MLRADELAMALFELGTATVATTVHRLSLLFQ
jgi:hypothetical protein